MAFNHAPKKHLGQNFLVNQDILNLIEQHLDFRSDIILEIGPGLGALTDVLLRHRSPIYAVEFDLDAIHYLRQKYPWNILKVIHADILTFDYISILQPQEKICIIGNLPYNISTPILLRLKSLYTRITHVYCMVQKEVADKLLSNQKHSARSCLSMAIQYFFQVDGLLDVGPENFCPAPKVFSKFIMLTPKQDVDAQHFPKFEHLIRLAYRHRRKILRNSIGDILDTDHPFLAKRPEALSVEDFMQLTLLYTR